MNIITKLNIRQKVMLSLTILAAAFLVWQIYNFTHGDTTSRPLTAVPLKNAPARNTVVQSPPPPVVRQLPANSLNNAVFSSHQREYLNLVHEYQITKMKRQILEEQAGLAFAQKRIADSGKGGALANFDGMGGDEAGMSGGYQLSYLDRQAGQWTATLNQSGQYREVHVGTRLTDGSKVVAITNDGVTLRSARGRNMVWVFKVALMLPMGLSRINLKLRL